MARPAGWETRRFLILVKTYPNPSASLVETVCTAGVDEQGRFTRLYPIPFRTMDEAKRFQKWQWIEARVQKARDPRPESFVVDVPSLRTLGPPMAAGARWPDRWRHVAPLLQPSMCTLEGRRDISLALIQPVEYSMTFEDDPQNWSHDQLAKLTKEKGAIDLFGELRSPKSLLQKLPVKIRYRFRCADPACQGHEKLFEDWEVGQSWRSWGARYRTRALLEAAIVNRYADEPRRHRNLYFFVGTLAAFPDTWVIIGHAQPLHLRHVQANQGELG